jgi:hypothetical protein
MAAQIVDLAHYRSMKFCEGDRRESSGALTRDLTEPRGDRWAHQPGNEQRRAEMRSEPRHILDGRCSPRLTLNGKTAVIRNVSRHGLMAFSGMSAGPGSRLLAMLPGSRPISARVVWRDGGLVGLDLPIEWPAVTM